jgi:DNA-binding MarR family transcriptional regulator
LRVPHSATRTRAALSRAQLADRFFSFVPALKRQFQASLPADLSDELSRVTPHQMEALQALHLLSAAGGTAMGATMNELARTQHCAMSTATALADRLIRQGLAERIPDPSDRRVIHIAPTAQGRELTRRFGAARREIALRALAPLNDAELTTLIELLDKVARSGSTDAGAEEMSGD